MENSMEGPQEIKIELQYNPAILLLGFYMEKNHSLEEILHSYVHHGIIHNSQDKETVSLSIDRWIDKENVVYTHNRILFPIRRRKSCHLQKNIWILRAYAKWNKSESERQILYDLTYIWNLKKKKNSLIKRTDQ